MHERRASFRVSGKVQGVFFRASTAAEAGRRGLRGWVRNREDGTVEGLVEGPADQVDAFLAWCHHGPPSARVDRVDVTDLTGDGEGPLPAFEVRETPR